MWWNILGDCHTIEGARRIAGHFVASVNDDTAKKDFWISAAQNTLTALFLAAARGRAPCPNSSPGSPTPPTAPRSTCSARSDSSRWPSSCRAPYAARWRPGTASTRPPGRPPSCLLDPEILAWVTPDPELPEFRPDRHVLGTDTLYLLSKDGGGSAAGVIAGLADATMRAGVVAAERMGGRLDPPLTAVLDEAANVCRISDLPDLYSHFGSRGINVVTLLQSYRQGARVWGEVGMDALWSAATVKLLGAGLDDADFVQKISTLVGQHDVKTPSISRSKDGTSRSYSYRQESVLPPDRIRALPKGTALLLATGVKPALIRLRPWYKEPGAGEISAAAKAETAAITERAAARLLPGPGLTLDKENAGRELPGRRPSVTVRSTSSAGAYPTRPISHTRQGELGAVQQHAAREDDGGADPVVETEAVAGEDEREDERLGEVVA